MIQRVLRGCACITFSAMIASTACSQDAAAPQLEAPKVLSPAGSGTGGTIFADINMGMPDEAFDLVAKQAGVDLVTNGDAMWSNAEPITLKVEGGYFWPVFLDMCKQANIRFQPDYGGPGGGRGLRLYDSRQMPDNFDRLPKSIHQGFVVMPQSASRTYSTNYSQPNAPGGSSFMIQMQVCVDPATPVTSWGMTQVTEAVDENGTSLVPKDSNAFFGGGNNNSLIENVGVPLANPANIGKKLVSLKGSLRCTAVLKMDKVELDLPLPAEGKTIKTSDGEIVIASLAQRGGQSKSYELKVRFITAPEDGSPRGGLRRQNQGQNQWNLVNSISVKDAQGKALNVGGGSGGNDGQGNMSYSVSVMAGQDVGEPAKLSWRLPVTTKQIQIPFEFKDLAIP